MRNMIFRPHTLHQKVITNKMRGTGMGSVLLDKGGAGSGSSYHSMADYLSTTGQGLTAGNPSMGFGLGGAIEDKLSRLAIKPKDMSMKKKTKNIKFSI
jgi:hypothetical protein